MEKYGPWRKSITLGLSNSAAFLLALLLAAPAIFTALSGCSGKPVEEGKIVLSVGETKLSLAEFEELFEFETEGFSDPETRDGDRMRFLQQMVEEMLVMECARTLGISVDSQKLLEAEKQIREDYAADYSGQAGEAGSQDAFEQMLVDRVVEYDMWKKALERRLLIEEVIARQVAGKIKVSDDEIRHYLDENQPVPQNIEGEDGAPEEALQAPDKEIHNVQDSVDAARRYLTAKKTEEAYGGWLMQLKATFPIQARPEFL